MNRRLSLTGVVLLALLASAFVVLGLALLFGSYESPDPRDKFVPLDGFLLATLGVGLSAVSWQIATRLDVAKHIEGMSGLVFSFFGIPALLGLILSVWQAHHWPSGLPPSGLVWLALAVIETQAALIWLLVKGRRARKAAATNGKVT